MTIPRLFLLIAFVLGVSCQCHIAESDAKFTEAPITYTVRFEANPRISNGGGTSAFQTVYIDQTYNYTISPIDPEELIGERIIVCDCCGSGSNTPTCENQNDIGYCTGNQVLKIPEIKNVRLKLHSVTIGKSPEVTFSSDATFGPESDPFDSDTDAPETEFLKYFSLTTPVEKFSPYVDAVTFQFNKTFGADFAVKGHSHFNYMVRLRVFGKNSAGDENPVLVFDKAYKLGTPEDASATGASTLKFADLDVIFTPDFDTTLKTSNQNEITLQAINADYSYYDTEFSICFGYPDDHTGGGTEEDQEACFKAKVEGDPIATTLPREFYNLYQKDSNNEEGLAKTPVAVDAENFHQLLSQCEDGCNWFIFHTEKDRELTDKYCNGEKGRAVSCEAKKGTCDYGTSTCSCFTGWKGEHCEERIGLAPVVIAVIIIASILVFAVLVGFIAVYLFKRYLREKRKIVLVAPDFEKLCFVTVKSPDYPPEISSHFDPGVIEQLIINDSIGMEVLWQVTKIMPLTDSDNFAKALVYAFARHDKALSLIMYFIKREVDETEDDPDTLFRANSYATKAFKFYSKMIGLQYLFRTIAVLLQGMLRDLEDQEENVKADKDNDIVAINPTGEIDPSKIDETSDENINVLMLQLTCQKFLVQILRSAPNCPGEFKQLCAHIKSVVQDKYPDYVSKAIGAFIFLRFFNTGITVPETYGLMPNPPKQQARRQLILLSKVLQNLANGVKFGNKETFMTRLNCFIEANQRKLMNFYDQICDPNGFASEKVEVSESIYSPSIEHIYYQCASVYISDPEVFNSVPEVAEMLRGCVDPSKAADYNE